MHTPTPEAIAASQMTAFMRRCEAETGEHFADAAAFHAFSVRAPRRFWSLFLRWSEILCDGSAEAVFTDDVCERANFFPELRLSYVENLLRVDAENGAHDGDRTALIASGAEQQTTRLTRLTRRALRDRVWSVAIALEELGVVAGDRVVLVAHNDASAVIAALAAAAIGATVASASPEMGPNAIVERFAQLGPVVLCAHLGTPDDSRELRLRMGEVSRGLPTLRALVALDDGPLPPAATLPTYRLSAMSQAHPPDSDRTPWRRFPFNHPLFILFSSGTTGAPKCIVHGAGGTLLEHVKEHRLHENLSPDDTLFFYTSCAWMMWNWQLSALATGAGIVLFSGPIEGSDTLWRRVSEAKVTVFGTSPTYLQLCQDAGYSPAHARPIRSLRSVLSTGSVLYDHQYDWVASHVGPLPLHSISGGTDILGCFVLGHPNLPVHRGESQSLSLGLDVQAVATDVEKSSPIGELVCRNPFPSRPLGFFGDTDGHRFHQAYFAANAGVWTHGDLLEIAPDGGARMHGRSDGILNVHGVRIGPAEIYRILQGIPEIVECMAVEENIADLPTQSRIVLLVVLRAECVLDGALKRRIRAELARRGSAFHVPERIVAVRSLPTTHSGKRSERSARDAVHGRVAANVGALRNPECLEEIRAAVEASRHASPSLASVAEMPLQARLTSMWERLLDLSPLSIDEDFFALGGTSLIALRLCALVQAEVGLDLSPSMLLEAPTIARLTVLLAERSLAPPSLFVPLRPTGSGRPLYLLPGLAGDVLELQALAQQLDCDRPVIGLRARGLDSREQPHATVEAMAIDYVAQLRAHQPVGPYAIAGYSFGGLVAFEIAARLRDQAQEVDFIGLLDTDVHEACLPPFERRKYQTLRALHRATNFFRWSRLPPVAWLRDALRSRLETELHATCGETSIPAWRAETLTPAMTRVDACGWNAFREYQPVSSPSRVTFFRAEVRAPDYCYPIPVWASATDGRLEICDVPGDHFTMIQEPHVGALAALMSRRLAYHR